MKKLLTLIALVLFFEGYAQNCKEIIDPFTNVKSVDSGNDSLKTDKGYLYFRVEKHKGDIYLYFSNANEDMESVIKVNILFTDDSKISLPNKQRQYNPVGLFKTYTSIKGNKIGDYRNEYEALSSKDIKQIRFVSDYIIQDQTKLKAAISCVKEN